jgi:hypothetical protein
MRCYTKYLHRSSEVNHGCVMGRRQVRDSLEQSSARSRHESMLAVTMVTL